MARELILVVDYGTSNVRVNGIDAADGSIASSFSKKYLVDGKGRNYSELPADHLWDYSVDCMERTMEALGADDRVCAIAFSFFGDALIPVDRDGKALNDCILCTDPRGEEELAYIHSQIPQQIQRATVGNIYTKYNMGVKCLWVKNHLSCAKDIAAYDSIQQYIFRRCGLAPVNDITMAARKQMFNINDCSWSKRILDVLGITEEQLGLEVVPTGQVIGSIRRYGRVDLKAEIPVVAGGHDCDLAMIGLGITEESRDIADIAGTFDHVGFIAAGVRNLALENPEAELISYNGPLKETTSCLGALPTSGATLEWFMREINRGAAQEDYNIFWNRVVFDGKGSVLVCPNFDSNRGRICGIGVTTTMDDLFRGVIEALTFENRKLIEAAELVRGVAAEHVRIGGGPAASDEWVQLRADISGKTFLRGANIQVSSLGGAILAAESVGLYRTLGEAIGQMVRMKDVFRPNEKVRERYSAKYGAYQSMMTPLRNGKE